MNSENTHDLTDYVTYKLVETLEEFVSVSREAMAGILEVNPSQDFYLTECYSRCCSSGTSYRFFAGMPKIDCDGHPDTYPNRESMIAKIYDQAPHISKDLADVISRGQEGTSPKKIEVKTRDKNGSTCYKI